MADRLAVGNRAWVPSLDATGIITQLIPDPFGDIGSVVIEADEGLGWVAAFPEHVFLATIH